MGQTLCRIPYIIRGDAEVLENVDGRFNSVEIFVGRKGARLVLRKLLRTPAYHARFRSW